MFSDSLVEFVDIMPSLVEAAGLPQLDMCPEYSRDIPICREGMSVLKIAQGGMVCPELSFDSMIFMIFMTGEPWKDAIFWQQPRGYWTPVTKNYQGISLR